MTLVFGWAQNDDGMDWAAVDCEQLEADAVRKSLCGTTEEAAASQTSRHQPVQQDGDSNGGIDWGQVDYDTLGV